MTARCTSKPITPEFINRMLAASRSRLFYSAKPNSHHRIVDSRGEIRILLMVPALNLGVGWGDRGVRRQGCCPRRIVTTDRRPRHRAARSSPGLEAIISGQGSAPESSLIQQAMESTLAQTSTPAPTQNNAPPPDVNTSESSTKWRPRGEYKDVTSERLGKQSLAHRNPAEAAAPLVTSPDLHLRYDARYAWPRSIQLLRQRHPLGRVHP